MLVSVPLLVLAFSMYLKFMCSAVVYTVTKHPAWIVSLDFVVSFPGWIAESVVFCSLLVHVLHLLAFHIGYISHWRRFAVFPVGCFFWCYTNLACSRMAFLCALPNKAHCFTLQFFTCFLFCFLVAFFVVFFLLFLSLFLPLFLSLFCCFSVAFSIALCLLIFCFLIAFVLVFFLLHRLFGWIAFRFFIGIK